MKKNIIGTPAKSQANAVGGLMDNRATLLQGSWMLYLR